MKHIVCFGGGHSSALAAIETVRRYGRKDVILLNHDISSKVEHKDIKRFKQEVSDVLEIPIVYANADDYENMTPCAVSVKNGMFNAGFQGTQICTNRLKTAPFMDYLKGMTGDYDIIYGFDMNEPHRIQRRAQMLFAQGGYKTDFPLAYWERTTENTEDIGIKRPITYKIYKHANCEACLKAGKRQWYVVYCLRPDLYEEAIWAEEKIGYSILKESFMKELVSEFEEIKSKGICPNQKGSNAEFWARVNATLPGQESFLPCDCAI